MSYFDVSAEKDGDAYRKMLESYDADVCSKHRFPENKADPHALAEITISSPDGKPITCIVSSKEGCILYNETRMQISTASPIGKFVSDNRNTLEVGMRLPNSAEILEIAYVNLDE